MAEPSERLSSSWVTTLIPLNSGLPKRLLVALQYGQYDLLKTTTVLALISELIKSCILVVDVVGDGAEVDDPICIFVVIVFVILCFSSL